jgi:drug/metabolite transporter (DMT)-like permease
MMYLLLFAADALFALQFVFEKRFRTLQGDDLRAALISVIYSSLIKIPILLITGGLHLEFTLFSFVLALVHSVVCLLSVSAGLKALATANLSVYSIFMMLGGMLLPFSFGILFLDEPLTVGKVICVLFILFSLLLTWEKGGSKREAYKYYLAVFVLNGSVGVISSFHQSRPDLAVSSNSFVLLDAFCSLLIPLCWYLLKYRKFPIVSTQTVLTQGGFALCNGIGNLFSMIALTVLPASVQFPIGTGGTLVFSALLGLCLKEKLNRKKVLSLLAAVIATILVIL